MYDASSCIDASTYLAKSHNQIIFEKASKVENHWKIMIRSSKKNKNI